MPNRQRTLNQRGKHSPVDAMSWCPRRDSNSHTFRRRIWNSIEILRSQGLGDADSHYHCPEGTDPWESKRSSHVGASSGFGVQSRPGGATGGEKRSKLLTAPSIEATPAPPRVICLPRPKSMVRGVEPLFGNLRHDRLPGGSVPPLAQFCHQAAIPSLQLFEDRHRTCAGPK